MSEDMNQLVKFRSPRNELGKNRNVETIEDVESVEEGEVKSPKGQREYPLEMDEIPDEIRD